MNYDSSLSLGPLYSLLELAPLTSHGNIPFRRRIRKRYTLLAGKLAAHLNEFMSSPPSALTPKAAAGTGSAWPSQPEQGLFGVLWMLKETPALPLICWESEQLQGRPEGTRRSWDTAGEAGTALGKELGRPGVQPPPSERPALPRPPRHHAQSTV